MASSVAAPSGIAVGHPRSKWTRVAALSFMLMPAGMVLWVAGMLIAGQPFGGDAALMAIAGGAGLVAAAAVWRFGTPGKAVALIVVLAGFSQAFWIPFSLFSVMVFVEFSGAVMFTVGLLAGIGYTIASIVRRDRLSTETTRGETRAMRVILAIVALAMVVSGVLNITMRTSVEVAAAADATPVAMSNFEFQPATYEVTAGESTQLLVQNTDAFAHDFVIEALGVNAGMFTPGSEKLVEVNPAAGEYKILCNLHPGMEATLVAQ